MYKCARQAHKQRGGEKRKALAGRAADGDATRA